MIQKFYNLEINTNGQRLYEFTDDTIQWIKESKFKQGILNLSIDKESCRSDVSVRFSELRRQQSCGAEFFLRCFTRELACKIYTRNFHFTRLHVGEI